MTDKDIRLTKNGPGSSNRNIFRLVFYDLLIYIAVSVLFLLCHEEIPLAMTLYVLAGGAVAVFGLRFAFKIYAQVWRYGGLSAYLRLIVSDMAALAVMLLANYCFYHSGMKLVSYSGVMAGLSLNLLVSMLMRMLYVFAYHASRESTGRANFFRKLLRIAAGFRVNADLDSADSRHLIKIAIVGAGRTGASLATELINNPYANYVPVAFIDKDPEKINRQLFGIPIIPEDSSLRGALNRVGAQEVVFALPAMEADEKRRLYEFYKSTGCKVKIYDYPNMRQAGEARRTMREFDIEELLFRSPISLSDAKTTAYYTGKVILVTGGGGSIGSELCRQLAAMNPQKLIILDVYENGAYDIQQELKIAYGSRLDLQLEILSVCDRQGLEKVFETYRPQIVLNAAAHKHVPLMEHNCCEAIKNNVFGTLNTVDMAVKYGAERFIMVSTDKAVNPTNVMGATKRLCEMIVQSCSTENTGTVFSSTRFGNVLGSAGSVIPLFRRQIAKGGPITLTDKRIIRYFMTIPEASQLVLQSGTMAKNGELFVLDMGKPVRILDLAENMIRLSGMEPYRDIDIVETGLRPGEKLYEELLIKNEDLDKTENSLIFIEKDTPLSREKIDEKLALLQKAMADEDNQAAKAALRKAVPTFRTPDEVNARAEKAEEMKAVSEGE